MTTQLLFLFAALSPGKLSLGDDDLLQTARAKSNTICIHVTRYSYIIQCMCLPNYSACIKF